MCTLQRQKATGIQITRPVRWHDLKTVLGKLHWSSMSYSSHSPAMPCLLTWCLLNFRVLGVANTYENTGGSKDAADFFTFIQPSRPAFVQIAIKTSHIPMSYCYSSYILLFHPSCLTGDAHLAFKWTINGFARWNGVFSARLSPFLLEIPRHHVGACQNRRPPKRG